MLFKLSLSNIRKSLRDYAIYFFTLIIGVSVFYVFNAIGGQAAMMEVSKNRGDIIELLTSLLSGVSVFVAGVLGLLIIYASRFLMKRRNKEFALYMMLGMGKSKISAILLMETIIIGIGSLGVGLIVGIGLSQLMSALVANLFEADMTAYKFSVSGEAIVKTILYFAVMYLVVMIFNSAVITKMKLIDLIQSGKRSEHIKLKNPWLCVLIFFIAAVALGYAYYQVGWNYSQLSGKKMTLYIAMGVFATFLIFWSVSGMLLRIVMSMKNVYFRSLNAFTFRQISSKVGTMVFSMTVICLMLFVTICTLAASFSVRNSMNANLQELCPADFEISYLEYAEPEEESLDELAELARTAGAEVAGRLIQKREAMHPVTYIGKGKILELKELLWETDATGIICDDELTSVQLNHLEEELECKIVDRTLLILDIFAGRAVSREGKIQVELAQLKYRAARLVGLRNSLSRLGGGIGTRGPGEKKLEMDRRLIRERISRLKKELREVEEHRERLRTQRKRSNLKVAALVGYTSAGKSSLENALTGAGVLEDAMLFSTLDTTTRSLRLADTQEILLSDTVGFIRKLPHHLVEAFKSTLEEAKYADIIIHVVDASNPHQDTQMFVVYETLRQLGAEGKPVITVFNKQDKLETPGYFRDFHAEYSIPVSAKTGQGLEELKEALLEILRRDQVYIERLYSFAEAGKIQLIRTQGQLLSEEYVPDGIEVKAYVPKEIWGKV